MTERTEYYPYGSIAATASNLDIGNHYKFTGKEADAENNLQYFGARYYDNRVGKFTAIDPYGLKLDWLSSVLSDPQSLNGYAYSRNNPIILVDPDGNDWETFKQGVASSIVSAVQHPVETIATVVVVVAAAAVAPVVVAVVGAGVGGFAIGTALGNAMNAPDANTRDYYLGQATTATALTAVGIKGAASISTPKPVSAATGIADDALVCRGGTCNASQFETGNGSPLVNGKLTNVSVQSGSGMSLQQLSKPLKNAQVGTTKVGEIRKLGGDVISTPSLNNPQHSTLQGITPQQAQSLFQPTTYNPWK